MGYHSSTEFRATIVVRSLGKKFGIAAWQCMLIYTSSKYSRFVIFYFQNLPWTLNYQWIASLSVGISQADRIGPTILVRSLGRCPAVSADPAGGRTQSTNPLTVPQSGCRALFQHTDSHCGIVPAITHSAFLFHLFLRPFRCFPSIKHQIFI
jgi:hypothetical protein